MALRLTRSTAHSLSAEELARLRENPELAPPSGGSTVLAVAYPRASWERYSAEAAVAQAGLSPIRSDVTTNHWRFVLAEPQPGSSYHQQQSPDSDVIWVYGTPPEPEVAPEPEAGDEPLDEAPDLWTPAARTEANLVAMRIAASKTPAEMTADDRLALSRYSGWGGLSIKKATSKMPEDFPRPHPRALIHEYYTPTAVVREVARMLRPVLGGLPRDETGKVLALEPSAGIGRFIHAASGPAYDDVRWTAVEWSPLAARMLAALRPDVDLTTGPFERWVAENGHRYAGRFGMVLANPPYGKRGSAVTEDPLREYREKAAYAYFLRRSLDLLAPGGIGVFLIPGGFLSGTSDRIATLRQTVLRRHHLSAAFRLPSGIFPGANLVIDLIVFRARGGELAANALEDRSIIEGRYFKDHPQHILGTEVGAAIEGEDVTKKARFGYSIEGEFTELPELVERRLHVGPLTPLPVLSPPKRKRARKAKAKGTEATAAAVWLGGRVTAYMAAPAAQAVQLHGELLDALAAWAAAYGNPHGHAAVPSDATGEAFLSAFTPAGEITDDLRRKPEVQTRPDRSRNVVEFADALYRAHHTLTTDTLATEYGGAVDMGALIRGGWALDGDDQLVPRRDYFTGDLWPKYDRAQAHIERGREPLGGAWPLDQIRRQAQALMDAIGPVTFEEIDGATPRQGWVPLDVIQSWMNDELRSDYYHAVELVRADGIMQVADVNYERLDSETRDVATETRHCIGWINHDKTVFRPSRRSKLQKLDEARVEKAAEWERSFTAYVAADEGRREAMEAAYNRRFRGYVQPEYGKEAVEVARWGPIITPYPHQTGGARRLIANRGGLLAYGVGVGKTFAAILTMAAARQEGWSKRPVILLPNSLPWKWYGDIKVACPDYRIAVIGAKRTTIRRGPRKGQPSSTTDTPAERAAKWEDFKAGLYDCVLLTYASMPRTAMSEAAVVAYSEQTAAIRREVRLRERNAKGSSGQLTERQEAVLEEGVGAWVAEQLELPESWDFDPGIVWDDLGVDLLIVDEAQNFKNLYLPEAREGGVPRFMGNAGAGAKRAWQLDFRAATVRKRTGGSGVILLSATPAKNSPLEFYNVIQYVDHDVWTRMGITDPEQFIDRYLRIELQPVLDSTSMLTVRSAVTGFQNLHELRDVLFRYGDFLTSEDVGLALPEQRVEVVEVDMNSEQEDKYDLYVSEIEAALESTDPEDRGKILGLLARMNMVAIHPRLDERYDYKTAGDVDFASNSPKFAALADRVSRQKHCGHIVFVENTAAHRWISDTLVGAGVAPERIAVLNAITAKATTERQRISDEFNGDVKNGVEPRYDVVIANQIAYEGVDLQRRTCAIHHIDLPWEPATLEQRNGRGVRQGNREPIIAINYYFAARSADGLRFHLITEKRNWLAQLLVSQDRATNNPAAQMNVGKDEILLMISRDPVETRKRLDKIHAKRARALRQRLRRDASATLRAANARFRKAEQTLDPATAGRLRSEAELRLRDLRDLDPEAWPWAHVLDRVRTENVAVTAEGVPLFAGTRVRTGEDDYPDYTEIGAVRGVKVGVRSAAQADWRASDVDKLWPATEERSDPVTPANVDPRDWPPEDMEQSAQAAARAVGSYNRFKSWRESGWPWANDAWLDRVWPALHVEVAKALAKVSQMKDADNQPWVPVLHPSSAGPVVGVVRTPEDVRYSGTKIIPPTTEGWYAFLDAAPTEGSVRFGELDEAARYWWLRPIPRDLLSSPRDRRPRYTAAPVAAPPRIDAGVVEPERDLIVEESGQLRLFNPSGLDPIAARHLLSGDVTREALEIVHHPPRRYGTLPAVVRKAETEPLTATERKALARLPEILDLGWHDPVSRFDDDVVDWTTDHQPMLLTPALLESPSLRFLDRPTLYSLLDRGFLRVVRMPVDDVPPPPPQLVRSSDLGVSPTRQTYTLVKTLSHADIRRLAGGEDRRQGGLFDAEPPPPVERQSSLFGNPIARPDDPVDITFPAGVWTEATARRWLDKRGIGVLLEQRHDVEGGGWVARLRQPTRHARHWYAQGETGGRAVIWHGEGRSPRMNPEITIERRESAPNREDWYDVRTEGGKVNAVMDPDFKPRAYQGEGDTYGGSTYGFLTNLWADPTRRRSGIGSRLVRAAVRFLHAQGVRRVIVFPETAESIALFRKLGFAQNYMRVRTVRPSLRGWELDLRTPPPWLAEANPKRIHGKVYVHRSALGDLSPTEQQAVAAARRHLPRGSRRAWDVCKVNPDTGGVTFSSVPTFGQEPEPPIADQWLVGADGGVRHMPPANPPHVYHRTELMLPNPGGDNQGRSLASLRASAERSRQEAERYRAHHDRAKTPGTPEYERHARMMAAQPQWESWEDAEILRSPGRPVAAIPASGRRDARQFVVFDLSSREQLAYLRKSEVVSWLVKEAMRDE